MVQIEGLKLYPNPIFSGGLILSYKCDSRCRHCMYACSPEWSADWMSIKDAEKILSEISLELKGKYPEGTKKIGVNYGIHFTGGEPFLNFNLLLKITEVARDMGITATFAETDCFWCKDESVTLEKLIQLKDAGLAGMLFSVNPFQVEHVSFENIERGIRAGKKVFGKNVIIYTEPFYEQLKKLDAKRMTFEEYLSLMEKSDPASLRSALGSLILMGRAPYKLGWLYPKYKAEFFLHGNCMNELTSPIHVHIDNYGNYMTGYCGGISLGDGRNLDAIYSGIELDDKPVLKALVSDGMEGLLKIGREFGYRELDGYLSRCHLCVDIRKHIVQETGEFKELAPREFYNQLDG